MSFNKKKDIKKASLLVKRNISALPWRPLLPVLIVMGMALIFWCGIFLLNRADTFWKDRLESYADQRVELLEERWNHLDGYLGSFSTLYLASNQVDAREYDLAAERVLNAFPSVKSLLFVSTEETFAAPKSSRQYWDMDIVSRALKKGELLEGVRFIPMPGRSLYKEQLTDTSTLAVFHMPLVSPHVKGVLFGVVDVHAFIKTAASRTAIMDHVGMRAVLTSQSSKTVLATDVWSMPKQGAWPHAYDNTSSWGGGQWRYTWHYGSKAAGGVHWVPGVVVMVAGVIMVLVFGWVMWSQQTISSFVRKQVIERTHELERASRRFRLITDNAYDLISIISREGVIEYANSAYHRVLGYSRDEIREKSVYELVHRNDLGTLRERLEEVCEGKHVNEVTFRMKHKKGHWVYLEAVAKALHGDDYELTNIVMHCRDITSRKRYADELARSEQRFRDFADSSADWLWEVNSDFEFTYVSPGIKQTLGYTPDEMIGLLKFDALFDKTGDMTRELIESRTQRHQPYRDIEFWTRSKAGERICLRICGVPIFNEKQVFTGYRGAATNITSSKLDRENMFRLATTDHLTNLLNRARFTEELERTLSLARRHKTQGVLLFIDLDQFKGVNDTYGHDAGDALIRAVAEVLTKSVRSTDIIARLGGDEFGIIMHNIDVDRARVKVQQVIDELNSLRVDYNGVRLQVTMSVGMITYPQEDRDSASLLMSADLAMYRAKDLGRNRLYIDADDGSENTEIRGAVSERKDSLREQLKWVDRLKKALDDGDFEMHYQAIVPKKKKKNPHFEALIRLRDEHGNIGAPGIFIDAAEHFGLIQRLDLAVIQRCFEEQLAMKKQGVEVDMSINLSGKSLGDEDVIEKLNELIKRYDDLKPENFTFEVTETAALHDPSAIDELEDVQLFVNNLKDMGFKFALDDFGTGFSSFNYIKHLNVDCVKIDGSFIKSLDESKTDRLFVKAIADLAKGLGIYTVAEFVENEDILKVLEEIGVDYAQGYHLSKPEPNLEDLYTRFKSKRMKDFEVSKAS